MDERAIKIERYKQLNKAAKKGNIVFAGSSLAEQFPVNELLQNFDEHHIIYNRGISGDTTIGLLNNIDTCILDLEPAKLFINIGSNDISLETYNENTLMDNYKSIINIVKNKLPDTKIFILSYYPVNPLKNGHENNDPNMFMYRNNLAIRNANERLKKLAEEFNFTYIDLFHPLLDAQGNLKESYTIEGIHMWPLCYIEVFNILKKYF